MSIKNILKELRENNIDISLDGENISLNSDTPVIADFILERIRSNKKQIIDYLKNELIGQKKIALIDNISSQLCYEMSSSQKRLWVLSQMDSNGSAYNMPAVYLFEGILDIKSLNKSFNALIKRHEILRTVFKESAGEVKQWILPINSDAFLINCQDVRITNGVDELVRTRIKEVIEKPFDLSTGPLLRSSLLQVGDNKFVFTYVMHHIISDGWSMGVMIRELLQLYNNYVKGEKKTLKPLRIQYKDYAAWQQDQLLGENFEQHKTYWLNQFYGDLPVLELQSDYSRPSIKTYNGAILRKEIPSSLTAGLISLIQEEGATLFMGLLGLVNVLLYKYTNQKDIIIGSPIAGREHSDLEDQIGFYVNTLALRTSFHEDESYRKLLQRIKLNTLGAYEHQAYPFDELVRELHIERDMSRNPLFDVMIALHNTNNIGLSIGNDVVEDLNICNFNIKEQVISKFDLTFNFTHHQNHIILEIEYNIDIYKSNTIERLGMHFESLMHSIRSFPDKSLSSLEYLSVEEKEILINQFNSTKTEFFKDKTLVDLFEKQVVDTPENVAIVFEEQSITYGELNERSNQLANYLRKSYKVKPNDLVGITLDRSIEMIIAILGILKSGAAYVPIDPEYPKERMDYLKDDSNCKIVLNKEEYIRFKTIENSFSVNNLLHSNVPEDLAYVIYTSGSTGRPKGVMIEHRGIVNTIISQISEFNVCAEDRGLEFASFSFDASVSEAFLILLSGASLFVLNNEQRQSPEILRDFINENDITIATIPPIIINQLNWSDLSGLKSLVTAGESPSFSKAMEFPGLGNYFNAYGPTESSICASIFKLNKNARSISKSIPIGKPLSNTQIYILGINDQVIPIGVVGEICVGGNGLARGYLNMADLTADKFVNNPFKEGERMYRTGDLGRWLEDGNVEFIGRKDDQVKIRGYRIELGEIENVLRCHEKIRECVVISHNEGSEKILVAYVTSQENLSITDLRFFLGMSLPSYMIPSHLIQLGALPLTSNGKLDKKSLPLPHKISIRKSSEYTPPGSEIEEKLVEIWSDVLSIPKENIGINDNFFELGGDSIKAIQIASRSKQKGYSITIQDILVYSNISDLVKRVNKVIREVNQEVVTGIVPLGPIQKWFFEKADQVKHHFNQSVLLRSKIRINEFLFEKVFHKIVLHHDALRTIFFNSSQEWVQENKGIDHPCGFEIVEEKNILNFNDYCDRVQASFDLIHGPLFKVVLFRLEKEDRLLLVAHHLIIDGISWRILLEDFSNLYQQCLLGEEPNLPLKSDSYKYWQQQLGEYAFNEKIKKEESYWLEVEKNKMHKLPLDNPYGDNLVKDMVSSSFSLNNNKTHLLLTKCYHSYHTDINDILLAALSLSLEKVFELDQVIIKMEGHGREDINSNIDVSRTVGWFTSTYPVVFNLDSCNEIEQLINVKEILHRIPNKGLGYGILKYLSHKNYNLNPEIVFNYLGDFSATSVEKDKEPVFDFSEQYSGKMISENMSMDCLLDISGIVVGGEMNISISYSSKQFNSETIQKLTSAYEFYLNYYVDVLSNESKTFLTPVDLTYKELSVKQLKKLNIHNNIEDIYKLSPLQEGIYYHWLVSGNSPVYFEQTSCRVSGNLKLDILRETYKLLVLRYPLLRTEYVRGIGEEILQIVKRNVVPVFNFKEVSDDLDFSLENFKKNDRSLGFDIHNDSLMRLTVLKVNKEEYEFIWSHHHILMDGWCISLIVNDFFQIYYDLCQNKTPKLKKINLYSSYIQWLDKIDKQQSIKYWNNYLTGYSELATLPKFNRKANDENEKKEISFVLNSDLRQSLREVCKKTGITENTFIQTLWGILLCKYNNKSDAVFGSIVSGRPPEIDNVEEIVGLFINTIPVRIRFSLEDTVLDLLKKNHQAAIEGGANHFVQLAQIQSESDLGQNLFDHVMVFENYPIQEHIKENLSNESPDRNKLSFNSLEIFDQTHYDFTITIVPQEKFVIHFAYNSSIYSSTMLNSLAQHLENLIYSVLRSPKQAIKELDYISVEEKNQLLRDFNATETSYPNEKTIVELFEEQVASLPEKTAVVFEETRLTYKELNERSNRLAHYLRLEHEIKSDDLIGIKLKSGIEIIITMLGILKAGAAYVPIDPEYPKERIDYIIEDSNCKLVLDKETLEKFNAEIILDANTYPSNNLMVFNLPEHLAYVMYTSGSTGKPKGVMITLKALTDYVHTFVSFYNLSSIDRVIQQSSISFDISIEEIFPALIQGAQLIILKNGGKDIDELINAIDMHKASVLSATPLIINELNRYVGKIDSIRVLISGGDELKVNQINNLFPNTNIYNTYGPTEATVCVTYNRIESLELDLIPIGRPVNNTQIYILDNYQSLLPVGVVGEICIGGDGLARGYLNEPELTAEKFVLNPFGSGDKIYRTGDLGRWLPDGNIEFMGRKDDQVKIRGYRIELGEIESVLRRFEGVEDAVVVSKAEGSEKSLVAYVTGREELNITDLRSYLGGILPGYMIPSYFVQLDKLPLTPNGKVDKKSLSEAGGKGISSGVEYVGPNNEIEETLAEIWSELLGRPKEKISVNHNFFELGGHSIKAIQLISRLNKAFNVEITPSLLFKYPTIKEISSEIENIFLINNNLHKSKLIDDNVENFQI